ncbi:hypothetical protein JCM9279_007225 [Rhodotorula babjevae]
MSHESSQPSLKRTTSTGAYGVNLNSEPSLPRRVPSIHLARQGRDWSEHNMFVPDAGSLRRHMRRERGLQHDCSDSSLHLSERAHRALGLERQLATSPTRSSADDKSAAARKPFVNLSDEDGSHSDPDMGKAPVDSSPDSDADSDSSSSDEGLTMTPRQPVRSSTWAHGGQPAVRAHERPGAARARSSSSGSSDDDDDDDGLVMAPPRRAHTAPGPSSSSSAAFAARPASTSRKGRPPPLDKDAFIPRPRDGPKSPSTTRHDGEPVIGRISSPVNEETRKQRRRSFDKVLASPPRRSRR